MPNTSHQKPSITGTSHLTETIHLMFKEKRTSLSQFLILCGSWDLELIIQLNNYSEIHSTHFSSVTLGKLLDLSGSLSPTECKEL